jgi:flagellar hook-associated protein 3 FlgL
MQRITNGVMISDLVRTLNERMRNLSTYQNQVATGKRVFYASDDPTAAGVILQTRNDLRQNAQYQENVDNALSWLQNTDSTLQGLNDLLTNVRTDAQEGSNEATTPEGMAALAEDVNNYLESLVSQANSDYSGKMVFGGTNTTDAPFTVIRDPLTDQITSVVANPDGTDGAMMRQVSANNSLQINISGGDLFQPNGVGGNEDIFQTLITLRDALNSGNNTAVGDTLDQIDAVMANLTNFTAFTGTRVNQLTSIQDSLLQKETNLTDHLAGQEDIDLVKVMTNLTMEQNAYQAALAAGAQIIQPSLVQFIQ